jgi:hypothetical protein
MSGAPPILTPEENVQAVLLIHRELARIEQYSQLQSMSSPCSLLPDSLNAYSNLCELCSDPFVVVPHRGCIQSSAVTAYRPNQLTHWFMGDASSSASGEFSMGAAAPTSIINAQSLGYPALANLARSPPSGSNSKRNQTKSINRTKRKKRGPAFDPDTLFDRPGPASVVQPVNFPAVMTFCIYLYPYLVQGRVGLLRPAFSRSSSVFIRVLRRQNESL